MIENNTLDRRFAVAPLMDWTDRHCRVFHRLMSRRARLYTEMLTTGAIIHGDHRRLLGFDPSGRGKNRSIVAFRKVSPRGAAHDDGLKKTCAGT